MANSHIGKVAVITGAAAGIGQAYATRLAADGATIVAADRQSADETVSLVKAAGGSAIAVPCDVSKPADVAALAQAVEAQFGRCDILVNNAGIYPIQTFDQITFEDWRRIMSVNLDGQFLTIKAFAPGMRQRGWGRIVNQASDTFALNLMGFAHYIASKGGVIGLTRALAANSGKMVSPSTPLRPASCAPQGPPTARNGWPASKGPMNSRWRRATSRSSAASSPATWSGHYRSSPATTPPSSPDRRST
jgi:NAD(P)-dependent dehydrogenase (short-subunit alcohol dehydrogenase family)